MTRDRNISEKFQSFVNEPTFSESKNLNKLFRNKKIRYNNTKSLKFAIGGNCNVDFLEPAISNYFNIKNIKTSFTNLEFNNWESEVFKNKISADWWVIWISSMGLSRGGTERNKIDYQTIQLALKTILSRGQRAVFILPEYLYLENSFNSQYSIWRENINKNLIRIIDKKIFLIKPEKLMINDKSSWYAPRYWSLAKFPCHPDSITKIGIEVSRAIDLNIKRKVKAIAVDLDDTLWGGIIGDLGYQNISIDPDGIGRPYLELQRFLVDQNKSGVPICVISKNELNIAMQAFKLRTEMILKKKDILHFYISWKPKYLALQKMSDDLNIGLDSICFIDDSKFEREQARKFIPELIVPEISKNPEIRTMELLKSGMFDTSAITKEDVKRAIMYKTDLKREKIKRSITNYSEYLKTLNMKLEIKEVDETNIGRISSLLEKTNQFNLTNIRTEGRKIIKEMKNKSFYSYCGSLKDKFGESGIIYVIIAVQKDERIQIIDWVMSCRVFGREVENASLNHLVKWSKKKGAEIIESKYVQTKKNKKLLQTLKELKFNISKDKKIQLDIKKNNKFESSIKVNV